MSNSTLSATDDTFADLVTASPVPVLVDYWATWCAPCRQVAPIVEQLAQEYEGRLRIVKVDADANPAAVTRAGVVSIPTLTFVVDGQVTTTLVGARPRAVIVAAIESVLTARS